MTLIPTILCGGVGSRLWPLSREQHPKPFIRLDDDQSLLQKTFLRAAQLPTVTDITTVTNRDLLFKVEDDIRPINTGGVRHNLILEPEARNTAAAIAASALFELGDQKLEMGDQGLVAGDLRTLNSQLAARQNQRQFQRFNIIGQVLGDGLFHAPIESQIEPFDSLKMQQYQRKMPQPARSGRKV